MSAEFRPIVDPSIYAQSLRRERLPFVVTAMFTKRLKPLADRLKASLDRIGLDYVLFEVPTVHSSISIKGTKEIAFSKPNFIHFVHSEYGLPVLYVDADMVFREMPHQVLSFSHEPIDFAAYNWLADVSTDAYVPTPVTVNGTLWKKRFYRFSHSVDSYDPTQLIVSGCAQYYTPDAEHMLRKWLEAIERFPEVADDELLDFTYNFAVDRKTIRAFWWTKDYSRCAWWITVRPIIDHPQMPEHNGLRHFVSVAGHERWNQQSVQIRRSQSPFPRDCIIDTKEKCCLRLNGNMGPTVIGRFASELWIAEEPYLPGRKPMGRNVRTRRKPT